MNIIIAGYARALNKLVDGQLGDDYVFSVPYHHLDIFLPLARKALNGTYIESKAGHTYATYTGTDVTISIGTPDENDILIPAHIHTLSYMVSNLRA